MVAETEGASSLDVHTIKPVVLSYKKHICGNKLAPEVRANRYCSNFGLIAAENKTINWVVQRERRSLESNSLVLGDIVHIKSVCAVSGT